MTQMLRELYHRYSGLYLSILNRAVKVPEDQSRAGMWVFNAINIQLISENEASNFIVYVPASQITE